MGARTLYDDPRRRVRIQASSACTPDMVSLLEKTVWGTRELLYIKHNLAAILERLRAPLYFSLREDGRLIAAGVCLQKRVQAGRRDYKAIHPAAIAVDSPSIGQGYAKLMVEAARPYLLEALGPTGVLYGFVESRNTRSFGLFNDASCHHIGLFHTQAFCRFFPKDDARVGPVREDERQELLAGLHECYAEHALLDIADSFRQDRYWVLREAGMVVAGIQAETSQWQILDLPGPRGLLMTRLMPHVPFVRRWFNVEEFRFLKLGNLYVRAGREADVFTLVESLLARHQVNLALAYFDRRSPMYRELKGAGDFGLMSRSLEFSTHVMAEFIGLGADEIADFQRGPLLISPLDAI